MPDASTMQTLLTLIEHYGLWLVFANVLALQLGLPVPAYPMLIVAGALTARGQLTLPSVMTVALAACLLADISWYFAGGKLGRRVLKLMCRLSLSPDSCVRQTERIYERWGAPSLMVAKFIPGFAAVATSMAGLVRTPLVAFLFFDMVGALLWSGAAVTLGWVFRDAVQDVIAVLQQAGHWGLLALLAALALYIGTRALQRYQLLRSLRMARVNVDELRSMIDHAAPPLIVDVRSQASQRAGRIPGALWIDSHDFDESLKAHGLAGRSDDEIIVYCACPNEASAATVAKKLMRAGFRRVRPLAGGIEAWVERGYAVECADD